LCWLKCVFGRYVRAKAGNYRRLIIVDNHISYLNMRFINYADRNHILLAFMPSHLSHRLQSLDLGLFRLFNQD
jgi:hypothetical protein